jgi:hypothetical protein
MVPIDIGLSSIYFLSNIVRLQYRIYARNQVISHHIYEYKMAKPSRRMYL